MTLETLIPDNVKYLCIRFKEENGDSRKDEGLALIREAGGAVHPEGNPVIAWVKVPESFDPDSVDAIDFWIVSTAKPW